MPGGITMRPTPKSREARSLLAAVLLFATATAAPAQQGARGESARSGLTREVTFRIPPQTLASAVVEFSDQAAVQLVSQTDDLADLSTRGVSGRMSVEAALRQLLQGAPIEWEVINGGTIALRRGTASAHDAESHRASPEATTGALTGRVTSGGKPVAGVTVTVTLTGAEGRVTSRVDTTNEEGVYTLSELPPSTYSVRFELEGLVPVTQEVRVTADQTTTVDATMELKPVEEEIVVTGSRIRRAEVEGPSPVIFINREDLDRTGRATVAEALATLPQNFAPPMQRQGAQIIPAQVDLRGLGSDNTLVLVNGRRVANSGVGPGATPFVDLNGILLAAVERIEVLTDGASALYGSDAVAGVVNIILKDDFRGSEVGIDYGTASEGGASERQVSFTTGGAWAGFRGLLTGEYFNRGRLAAADRTFSRTDDQRARGGRDFRITTGNPGNIRSLDGENLPGLDAPFAGIPAGQDGRNLMPEDFVATAGQLNLESTSTFIDLVAPSERWGVDGRVDRDLGASLTLFAEAAVTHTTNDQGSPPPFLANVTVPASNPFNPFGEDVLLEGFLATEIPRTVRTETDNLRALFGLEGHLGKGQGKARGQVWAWESSLVYSRDEFDVPGFLEFRPEVVNELLSRTDPATALNVFGDGAGANPPAVLEELVQGSSRQTIDGVGDLLSWQGQLEGVLARWAERELRVAAGAEYREEGLDQVRQNVFAQAPPELVSRITGDREVAAGFVELSLPLFGQEHQHPGVRALELQLAGRWESYSDFGETANPRLAVLWKPLASLALRVSASTGFRAPALQELFLEQVDFANFPVVDPRRDNETAFVVLKFGGNLDLETEESESFNLGMVWDVPGVPGLSLTLDGYRVRQDEQITSGVFLASELSEELEVLFPNRYRRAEPTPEDIAAGRPGQLLEVDGRSLNVSEVEARGVDLGLQYFRDTSAGRFDLRVNGAYMDALDVQLTPLAPVEQVVGTTGLGLASNGSPVRFRGNLSLFWSRGAWELGGTERYTGAPREATTASPLFGQKYDDQFETDLQVSYSLPGTSGAFAGTRLSLAIENLFNEAPPFRDSIFGYLGSLYSPRQRFVSLTLSKAFGGGPSSTTGVAP